MDLMDHRSLFSDVELVRVQHEQLHFQCQHLVNHVEHFVKIEDHLMMQQNYHFEDWSNHWAKSKEET